VLELIPTRGTVTSNPGVSEPADWETNLTTRSRGGGSHTGAKSDAWRIMGIPREEGCNPRSTKGGTGRKAGWRHSEWPANLPSEWGLKDEQGRAGLPRRSQGPRFRKIVGLRGNSHFSRVGRPRSRPHKKNYGGESRLCKKRGGDS